MSQKPQMSEHTHGSKKSAAMEAAQEYQGMDGDQKGST